MLGLFVFLIVKADCCNRLKLSLCLLVNVFTVMSVVNVAQEFQQLPTFLRAVNR